MLKISWHIVVHSAVILVKQFSPFHIQYLELLFGLSYFKNRCNL